MKNIWISALGLAALALTGCGPLNEGGTAGQIGQLVVGRVTGAQAAPPPPAGLPQEELEANPGKYMRVNIRDQKRWDSMVRSGANGSRVTWVNPNNISLTVDNGILVATRGLPRDLMGADVSETLSAIRSRGGNAQRTHEFIADDDGISMELLQCRIAFEGPEVIERLQKRLNSVRFQETCKGETLGFTNIYWLNSNGQMLRSLQAVSPDAGYLQIDVY